MPIQAPPPRQGSMGSLLQIGGLAAGAMNPAALGASGAFGGAMAGAGAGGLAGSLLGGGKGPAPQIGGQGGAMQRRMQQLQPIDPGQTLANAETALQKLPEQYQQQYGPTIRRARAMSEGVA